MRRLEPPVAVSLYYAATFAVLGVQLPYFNLYLDTLGFGGLSIGIVNAILPLCSALVPFAGGLLADRLGRRRGLVLFSSILAFVAFLPIVLARGVAGVALITTVYALARAPALPLVDASALEIAAAGGPSYGRMRAWGSFAFIVAALLGAPVVALLGEHSVLLMMLLFLGAGIVVAWYLPRDEKPLLTAEAPGSVRAVLRRRGAVLFLIAAVLSQAAHGPYYVFFSLHLKGAGIPTTTVGLLWAVAIGCEILMMLRMPAILARFGTARTMTLCLGLSTVRWAVCAGTTHPMAVALAQTFHAGTFAAFHVAAVTHTHTLFGPRRSATGQAMFSSVTYGLGNILGMVGSGLLEGRFGTSALFAMASATALLGAACMAMVVWRSDSATSHTGKSSIV
jgi:PPP family 3-phenylpropionic acid transporter